MKVNKICILLMVSFLLTLVLTGILSAGEYEGMDIEILSPCKETEPGEIINLLCEVINDGQLKKDIEMEIELFPGWKLLTPPEQLSLTSGMSETVIIPVYIGGNSRAGHYVLPISVTTARSQKKIKEEFIINVKKRKDLSVKCLEAPDYAVSGEKYRVKFIISNRGNTEEKITLQVKNNLSFPLQVNSDSVKLQPGEERVISVEATVPENYCKSVTQYLKLKAVNKRGKTIAVSSARIKVIPRKMSRASIYHTYPLQVTLGRKSGNEHLNWQLWGSGKLREGEENELFINYNEKSNFLKYSSPLLQITAGDKSVSFSQLTELYNKEYLQLLRKGKRGNIGLFYCKDKSWGLKAARRFNEKNKSSIQYLDFPRTPALLTVKSNFSQGSRFHLNTEYGQHLGGAEAAAFTINTGYSNEKFNTYLSFRKEEESFLGREKESNYLRVYSNFPFWNFARFGINYLENNNSKNVVYKLSRKKGSGYQGIWLRKSLLIPGDYRCNLFSKKELKTGDCLYQKLGIASYREDNCPHKYTFYNLYFQRALPDGVFNSHLNYRYSCSGEKKLGAGLYLSDHINEKNNFRAGLKFYDLYESNGRFYLQVEHETDSKNIIKYRGEFNFKNIDNPVIKTEISYTTAFTLPLRKKENLGEVCGQIKDGEGRVVRDVIVQLAGETTITGEKGKFYFPAVPAGRHYLSLKRPESYNGDYLFLPADLIAVKVEEDKKIEKNFRLVRGVDFSGRIILQDRNEEDILRGSVLYGEVEKEQKEITTGIIIEMLHDGKSYRKMSDSKGFFAFRNLPPGNWKLRVHRNGLSDLYKVKPEEKEFYLKEGEDRDIEIDIIPVKRTVKMLEGGKVEYGIK